MWRYASRIRSKHHGPRDELRVNPIRLGPCAPARRERFDLGADLGGWQLPGRDLGNVESGAQPPFLPASGLEANECVQFKSGLSDLSVTFNIVRQPRALAF